MQNEPKNENDTLIPVDDETLPDEVETFDADQTIVMVDTVELNVDELVAEVEAEDDTDVARKQEIRRRLEQVAEGKSFEDTYAVDIEKN